MCTIYVQCLLFLTKKGETFARKTGSLQIMDLHIGRRKKKLVLKLLRPRFIIGLNSCSPVLEKSPVMNSVCIFMMLFVLIGMAGEMQAGFSQITALMYPVPGQFPENSLSIMYPQKSLDNKKSFLYCLNVLARFITLWFLLFSIRTTISSVVVRILSIKVGQWTQANVISEISCKCTVKSTFFFSRKLSLCLRFKLFCSRALY